MCKDIRYSFWKSIPNSITSVIEREGKIVEKIFSKNVDDESYLKMVQNYFQKKSREDYVKILNDNIAYLNLGILPSKKIERTLNYIRNTKAVILDLRNYPSSSIQKKLINFFSSRRRGFAKFMEQDLTVPGGFKWGKTSFCGRNHFSKYHGKIIVLINSETQSYAEYLAMALQTIPNLITVGSHTAGADGDRISILLPGNIKTYISGKGVYYPNEKVTQRTGIVPDIIVNQTINGIRTNSDEVLNKAIEIITRGK